MTIQLAVGEQRQLNVQLTPVTAEVLLSVYDVFLTSNYRSPTAADNYIHARIRNDGPVAVTREIIAYYWEEWMGTTTPPPHRNQVITINPGQTIEYHSERFHGNDYTEYASAVWLTGDWTEQPLTRRLNFQAGMHLRPSQGDPLVEAHVHEVGSDYVILRYMQYGTCNKWQYDLKTPPPIQNLPYEQYLRATWYTDPAYCAFWLVPGLLPSRLYEAHLEGGTTANREDWIQFSTKP